MPNDTGLLTHEELIETVEAYIANGRNKTHAADALGMERKKFSYRYTKAVALGITGEFEGKVPDGMEINKVSRSFNKEGDENGSSIHMGREKAQNPIPKGMGIKGISRLQDAQGNMSIEWVRYDRDKANIETTCETIKEAFQNYKPVTPNITLPKESNSEKLTVYPLADLHLGMFAYAKETGGDDWDLSLARMNIVRTFMDVVEQTPNSEQAILLGLGDILHGDDSSNMTKRSKNVLDVDTRYSKILETACDLIAECSELVASKHKNVEMAFKAGNHDTDSTVGIAQALRMNYRNHKRISVDTSPTHTYWKSFGKCLIGANHGDQTKFTDIPIYMANSRKEDWATSISRNFYSGHIHHETTREQGGVKCHSLRAPIPQDAYHAAKGYLSGRSMYAFNFHSELGSRGRNEVEIL